MYMLIIGFLESACSAGKLSADSCRADIHTARSPLWEVGYKNGSPIHLHPTAIRSKDEEQILASMILAEQDWIRCPLTPAVPQRRLEGPIEST